MKYIMSLILAGFVALSFLGAMGHTSEASNDNNDDDKKVTICHATNSVKNPYVRITVSDHAADGNTGNDNGKGDHSSHTGPVATSQSVAQSLKDSHTAWGDIIPPHDNYGGLNWTAEGQTLYNNGCNFSTQSTPTPTSSISPTPSLTHKACVNNACVVVSGAGNNTCNKDKDCKEEEAHHYACVNNACQKVSGAGDNTCHKDKDCKSENSPTPTPTGTSATPTPTPTSGPSVQGTSDNRSDNLGCSVHDCSNQNQNSSQGQVLGASTSGQTVSGLSGTDSGNGLRDLVQLIASFSFGLTGLSFFKRKV